MFNAGTGRDGESCVCHKLPVMFFAIRFIYRYTIGKKLKTTVTEDYQKEAEGFEKAGSFVSAARIYEKKLKDYPRAASLYEQGKDYNQAAMLYDVLGMSGKAKEMYKKAGSLEDAAEVALLEGEFDEAAALYDKAGKKIDVAKIMQQSGKTINAVKAYREAGEYKKAAMLLKSEGILSEAADMLQIYLYDKKPENSTLDDFYTYASVLENTGNVDKAVGLDYWKSAQTIKFDQASGTFTLSGTAAGAMFNVTRPLRISLSADSTAADAVLYLNATTGASATTSFSIAGVIYYVCDGRESSD